MLMVAEVSLLVTVSLIVLFGLSEVVYRWRLNRHEHNSYVSCKYSTKTILDGNRRLSNYLVLFAWLRVGIAGSFLFNLLAIAISITKILL